MGDAQDTGHKFPADMHLNRVNLTVGIVTSIGLLVIAYLSMRQDNSSESPSVSLAEWSEACAEEPSRDLFAVSNDPDGWVNFRAAANSNSRTIGTLLVGTVVCASPRAPGDRYWPIEIHDRSLEERTGYVHSSRLDPYGGR